MKLQQRLHPSWLLLLVVTATLSTPTSAFLPRGKRAATATATQKTGLIKTKNGLVTAAQSTDITTSTPTKVTRRRRADSKQRQRHELSTKAVGDDEIAETDSDSNNNNDSDIDGPSLKAGSLDFSKVTAAVKKLLQSVQSYKMGEVWQNIKEGELGKRGEAYFFGQAALILCIVVGGVPVIGAPLRFLLGPSLLLAGVVAALYSVVDLGSDSLSPFPKPASKGLLKTTGIYEEMRHPMYTALLSFLSGLALVTNSADRVLLTGFLWYLLEVKSDKEEDFLVEQYGQAYLDYKVRT